MLLHQISTRPMDDPARKRVLDLCCGAGGLSLGFHQAGWNVMGIDTDRDSVETHRAMGSLAQIHSIAHYHPDQEFSVVVGGPPCQPFSVAGDQEGVEDDRGRLYQHMLRIADECRASVVLIENVRGMRQMRTKDTHEFIIEIISREFRERGYHTSFVLLNAADYGVPQSRTRLFFLAVRGERWSWSWPMQTHGLPITGSRPHISMREALSLPACPWGEDIFDSTAPTVMATEPQSDVNGIELDQTPRRASERIAQGVMEQIGQWLDPAHAEYVAEIQRRLGLLLMPNERRAGLRLAPEILAVLQGFPNGTVFVGSKTSRSRQIGNAVPPPIARVLAEALWSRMHGAR